MIELRRADFADARLTAFLEEYLDELRPTAPAESRHALDFAALQRPGVRLFAAYDGPEIVATGALAELGALEPGAEELKSMRTHPARRGGGIASRMLAHLLEDARGRNVSRLFLDTGSMDFFRPARSLYAKAGFSVCEPYGRHVHDPNTVYMTLEL